MFRSHCCYSFLLLFQTGCRSCCSVHNVVHPFLISILLLFLWYTWCFSCCSSHDIVTAALVVIVSPITLLLFTFDVVPNTMSFLLFRYVVYTVPISILLPLFLHTRCGSYCSRHDVATAVLATMLIIIIIVIIITITITIIVSVILNVLSFAVDKSSFYSDQLSKTHLYDLAILTHWKPRIQFIIIYLSFLNVM